MIKKLWLGVTLEQYNQWFPLTGKIVVTPEKYIKTWSDTNEWFKTFALRAQNDINAYLQDILRKFDFETFIDARIKETLVDMVFLIVEHWVYNRTPIELNTEGAMVFNNGQTQINNFATPTINIYDLHPSRMKIWANFTGLKQIFDTYEEEGLVDANLIDLDQYYSKTETDAAIADAIGEVDLSVYETKEDHKSDIDNLDTRINNFGAIIVENTNDINDLKDSKEDKLTSGTSIRTVNGISLLGSGNIQTAIKSDIDNLQNNINTKVTAPNGVQNLDMQSFDATSSIFVKALTKRGTSEYITFDQVKAKQDGLVSGQNIKTVNNQSLLGSGNINITTTTNNWILGEYKHVPAAIGSGGVPEPGVTLPSGWKVVKNYDDNTPTILANIPKTGLGDISGIVNNLAGGNNYTLELTAIQGASCFSLFKIIDNDNQKTGQLGFLNTILIQYDPVGTFEAERKAVHLKMNKLEALKAKRLDTYTNYLVARKVKN
ncbi:hypothetical protein LT336_00754 [Spiroplasma sp. JKS002671]|nr:hypothetical protein [Spiroplasma sp. JKS002671]MCL8211002.1 hypothetical protein [Spiroplasma sp. JKS002671]